MFLQNQNNDTLQEDIPFKISQMESANIFNITAC